MPDPSTSKVCPTKSILDVPTNEDSFRHTVVADAIAALILNEQGGRAIALHGKWGSGKSTIVGMVTKKLQSSSAKVFMFDAWAHQGDPLRRTFLEQLIDAGLDCKWLKDRDKWQDRNERLARRKETTDTSTSPRLTGWGIVGALSLLIAAPAIAIYNKVHYEWHKALSISAFVFSCSPLLVGLAILLWWWLCTERSDPLPNLIFSSTQTRVESTSTKTPDPTSLEFEHLYCEILQEMLGDQDRQLVFVIDNLDRMSKEDARSIWSTMRTFFDGSAPRTAPWHARLWMLVPFDPDAIREIFPDSEMQHGDLDNSIGPSFPRYYDDTAEHFLEKTFQVSFNVPPIIVSNWEQYLISLLTEAFPEGHSVDEFHRIFRVFDRKRGQQKPPTPRQLKVFVNSIGSLHRIWHDRIPLVQQATYALLFTRSDFIISLTMSDDNNALMGRNLLATVGLDWRRNFAAMYFNVEPDAAFETLMFEPVQRALRQADKKSIQSLSNGPGFREVLERVLELSTDGNVADPSLIANSALALAALDDSYEKFASAWQSLRLTAPLISEWMEFDTQMAEGILAIDKSDSRSSYISTITSSLTGSLRRRQVGQTDNATAWLRGISLLLTDESVRVRLLEEGFRVPGDADEYIATMAIASATPSASSVACFFKPAAEAPRIVETLVSRVQQGNWDYAFRNTLSFIFASVELDTAPLGKAMATRIRELPQATPIDCASLVLSLFDLALCDSASRQCLMEIANDQTLYQRYDALCADSIRDAAAVATVVLLSGDQDISQQFNGTNAWQQNLRNAGHRRLTNLATSPDSDPELLKEAARIAIAWQAPSIWLSFAERHPNRKNLIARILSECITQNPQTFPADVLLGDLEKWRNFLSDASLSVLLNNYAADGTLIEVLKKEPMRKGQEKLYLMALDGYPSTDSEQFLKEQLQNYSKADWISALDNRSDLLTLARRVNGGGFALGSDFQDAALSFIERSAASGTAIDGGEYDFVGFLTENDRLAFGNSLTSLLKSYGAKLIEVLPISLLALLGSQVLLDGVERHSESIKQIIETGSEGALMWLRQILGAWETTTHTQKAVKANFKSRAEKRLENEDGPNETLNSLFEVLSK